ncbi:MAG TPA: PAS domain-containing protein [Coriobacteriia bacterium]|nr:PAS domain-containing protein [Coriobacteriia bacterium]
MESLEGDIPTREEEPQSIAGCCRFASAIQALTVPFVVFDPNTALLSNPVWNGYFTGGADPTGMDADAFLDPNNLEAGRLRRNHLFEQGSSLDGVYVHAHATTGEDLRLVVNIERIAFGGGEHGILIVQRKINDDVFTDFTPLTRFGRRRPALPNVCIHEAVFESFPLPLLITDERFIIAANLQARLLLGEGLDIVGMRTLDLVHADATEAAVERREMMLGQPGRVLRNIVLRMSMDKAGRHAKLDVGSFEYDGAVTGLVVVRDVLP